MKSIYAQIYALYATSALVIAQIGTSLYVPGVDPRLPISADVLGIDTGAGQTTWAVHMGRPDATDTRNIESFEGTATLVEGSKLASLTYANVQAGLTIGVECTLSEDTLAICAIGQGGSTAVQTEAITYIPVQGGATISLTSTATMTRGSTAPIPTTKPANSSTSISSGASSSVPTQTDTSSSPMASSSSCTRPTATIWIVIAWMLCWAFV